MTRVEVKAAGNAWHLGKDSRKKGAAEKTKVTLERTLKRAIKVQ